jgi:hypothetical protein
MSTFASLSTINSYAIILAGQLPELKQPLTPRLLKQTLFEISNSYNLEFLSDEEINGVLNETYLVSMYSSEFEQIKNSLSGYGMNLPTSDFENAYTSDNLKIDNWDGVSQGLRRAFFTDHSMSLFFYAKDGDFDVFQRLGERYFSIEDRNQFAVSALLNGLDGNSAPWDRMIPILSNWFNGQLPNDPRVCSLAETYDDFWSHDLGKIAELADGTERLETLRILTEKILPQKDIAANECHNKFATALLKIKGPLAKLKFTHIPQPTPPQCRFKNFDVEIKNQIERVNSLSIGQGHGFGVGGDHGCNATLFVHRNFKYEVKIRMSEKQKDNQVTELYSDELTNATLDQVQERIKKTLAY